MKLIAIICGILLVLAAGVYLATLRMFRRLFRRNTHFAQDDARFLERLEAGPFAAKMPEIREGRRLMATLPFEALTVRSEDGLSLYARLYTVPQATRTMVIAHGFQSSGEHDFSGAFGFYREQGYNLLVIDQRAHGKSEGTYICFGEKEQYDVRAWCRLLAERFGNTHKIILAGISMGATTVLLAACLPYLPETVCGVIADCGFVSPAAEFRHVLRDNMHLPLFPLLPLADCICRHRAHFRFDAFSTADALRTCKIPVLFIHGEADTFVLPENTRKNYAACAARKELLTVPGAEHGMSYLVDEPLYRKTVIHFLNSL